MLRALVSAVPLLAAALASAAGAASPTPACDLPAGGERLSSPRFALSYRLVPEHLTVGRHFALEFAVCPRRGGAAPASAAVPDSVRVDASMPEHRHGMNYKTSVTALPGGRYRAEGLLLHMIGRWELVFELRAGGRTDRLSHSIVVE